MSKWIETELGDFIELKRGYDLPQRDRTAGKTPIISSSGISGIHGEAKVKGPGVVTGRYGTIGEVFYCEEDFWPLNTTLYVKDFKGNDPLFTYYFLKTIRFSDYSDKAAVPGVNRNHLHKAIVRVPRDPRYQKCLADTLWDLDKKIAINTQTNQTLESIAQAIFKSWFVDFEPVKAKMAAKERWYAMQPTSESASPVCYADEAALSDLETYTNLAAMCAISGKNETELAQLQQQNPDQYQQLAETAALFPSTMVDSELGEIPEGWEVGCYEDILEFNPKRTLKKGQLAPYLDMQNVPTVGHNADDVVFREMNSGTKFVNGDTLLARITPCLENGKTSYVDFLDDQETGWGSTEFIVMRSKEELPSAVSYFIARQDSFRRIAIQSMTGTSGRQRADAKTIASSPTIIPPRKLLRVFGGIAEGHLKSARSNHVQSKTLAQLRDSLLPKLLSGEIDLTEIRSEVA